jgi:hypothetical protein
MRILFVGSFSRMTALVPVGNVDIRSFNLAKVGG